MLIIRLLFGIFAAGFIGYSILILLRNNERHPPYYTLSLSYLLGVGAIVLSMFTIGICGGRLTFTYPLLFWLPLSAYAFITKKPDLRLNFDLSFLRNVSFFEWLFITLIALRVLYVFFQSLLLPIYSWDAFATWAYRAKVFYFDGFLNFSQGPDSYPHASYPNLIPLFECWIYYAMGEWNDRAVKIIFPLFFVSLLSVTFFYIHQFCKRIYAIIGVYLITAMPFVIFHSTIAYSDVPLMIYTLLSIMSITMWLKEKRSFYLKLAGISAGLAAFTKLEGTAYMAIITLLFAAHLTVELIWTSKTKKQEAETDIAENNLSFKRRFFSSIKTFFIYFIPAGIIGFSYMVFKKIAGVPNERVQIDFVISHIDRIPDIAKYFFFNLFAMTNWNINWALMTIAVLFNLHKLKDRKLLFPFLVFLSFVGLYVMLFLTTVNFEFLEKGTLLNRSFVQFAPLTVFITMLFFFHNNTATDRLKTEKREANQAQELNKSMSKKMKKKMKREKQKQLFSKRKSKLEQS